MKFFPCLPGGRGRDQKVEVVVLSLCALRGRSFLRYWPCCHGNHCCENALSWATPIPPLLPVATEVPVVCFEMSKYGRKACEVKYKLRFCIQLSVWHVCYRGNKQVLVIAGGSPSSSESLSESDRSANSCRKK